MKVLQLRLDVADSLSIVEDHSGIPALSVFLWKDGAPFDKTFNSYMSAGFPAGIDPASPMGVLGNSSFQKTATKMLLNDTTTA